METENSNKIFYNKLVRDHVKSKIETKGESCEIREITDEQEFQQELFKKITEESRALSHVRTRADFLKEYADLMVVLDALTQTMGFSEADIQIAIEENVKEKGFYKDRQFLHWSDDSDYESNESPQGVADN